MTNEQPISGFNVLRTVRKYFVSAFVVASFIIYALHERLTNGQGPGAALPPASPNPTTEPLVAAARESSATATMVPPAATTVPTQRPSTPPTRPPSPTRVPTASPQPTTGTAARSGTYKDGEYTGPTTNAYWGNVQVKAVVKGGKLTTVQVLEFPQDRRTSQRINSVAIPELQTEAVQAQSANVDLITGATLTSRAFAQSLQLALQSAKGGS